MRLGTVLGRTLSFNQAPGFVPPEERLYAGGASSVRGFQQNALGDVIYISRDVVAPTPGQGDTVYFRMDTSACATRGCVGRVVPVGGNSLIVANFELRLRSRSFPDLLQYTFFADAGDVWQRGTTSRTHNASALFLNRLKWTPGIGVRIFTPVGPFQANVGYNPYPQLPGAIYYDKAPNAQGFAPLYCVTPGNRIPARPAANPAANGEYEQLPGYACPATFAPPQSHTFLSRLTFTFSIGPDF
jgi:outer membrane protein insertion porin family/translocation and assembly module TamA